jgi:hypothetical protein
MRMMTNGFDLRHITLDQLVTLGVSDIAYVKPVVAEGRTAYAIHTADGRPVAVMEDRDVAFAAVRQNDLEPVSVH